MQLGTELFTCQERPEDDQSTQEIYGEMLELSGPRHRGLASTTAARPVSARRRGGR